MPKLFIRPIYEHVSCPKDNLEIYENVRVFFKEIQNKP